MPMSGSRAATTPILRRRTYQASSVRVQRVSASSMRARQLPALPPAAVAGPPNGQSAVLSPSDSLGASVLSPQAVSRSAPSRSTGISTEAPLPARMRSCHRRIASLSYPPKDHAFAAEQRPTIGRFANDRHRYQCRFFVGHFEGFANCRVHPAVGSRTARRLKSLNPCEWCTRVQIGRFAAIQL